MPSQWRHANVCAVHKKGKKSDPSNYGPVSLTCIASKVLEHIVHIRVMKDLSQYGELITDYQNGFSAKRSTETQLIFTIHDIASAIQSNKTTHFAIPLLFKSVWQSSSSSSFDETWVLRNSRPHYLTSQIVSKTAYPISSNWGGSICSRSHNIWRFPWDGLRTVTVFNLYKWIYLIVLTLPLDF